MLHTLLMSSSRLKAVGTRGARGGQVAGGGEAQAAQVQRWEAERAAMRAEAERAADAAKAAAAQLEEAKRRGGFVSC